MQSTLAVSMKFAFIEESFGDRPQRARELKTAEARAHAAANAHARRARRRATTADVQSVPHVAISPTSSTDINVKQQSPTSFSDYAGLRSVYANTDPTIYDRSPEEAHEPQHRNSGFFKPGVKRRRKGSVPSRASASSLSRPGSHESWRGVPPQIYGSAYSTTATYVEAIPFPNTPSSNPNDDPFDAFSVRHLPPHVIPLLQTGRCPKFYVRPYCRSLSTSYPILMVDAYLFQ